MKPKIYLETTIISYLTAHPSRDLITAANQQVTHEWWTFRRDMFDLLTSEIVVQESSKGDVQMVQKRLVILASIALVEVNDEANNLAAALLAGKAVPEKAAVDALHISIAAVHKSNYLLTWNCKHIANGLMQPKIAEVCRANGYESPLIYTPFELLGE
ncbi:MAG TPA: type II toxin-antitoxin system VapC family toxin [Pyrinomonadaceae bacterium]|jgi:hypothetical protein|nr:type II toxin-antitoxin system VapC family toxin [Pyrinomonadaceae bacterium]